jgi:hypothetical protein
MSPSILGIDKLTKVNAILREKSTSLREIDTATDNIIRREFWAVVPPLSLMLAKE